MAITVKTPKLVLKKSMTKYYLWHPESEKVWCNIGDDKNHNDWVHYKSIKAPILFDRLKYAKIAAGHRGAGTNDIKIIKFTQTIVGG